MLERKGDVLAEACEHLERIERHALLTVTGSGRRPAQVQGLPSAEQFLVTNWVLLFREEARIEDVRME